jgi:hypothetical protein
MLSRPRFLLLGLLLSFLTALPLPLLAAARKPNLSIGFHVQVRTTAPDPFSFQIRLKDPSRIITLERAPSLSENHVSAIHLYPNSEDETWGCLFKLSDSGRLILSNISSANRGKTLVFFLGNATFNRPVADLLIDSPVEDGLINIPRGITAKEVEVLRKQFPKSIKPREAR